MIERNKTIEREAPVASVQAAQTIPPLALQSDGSVNDAAHYEVRELLRYHDRAFITHVYAAILKRHPTDAELAQTLAELRGGQRSKLEIIGDISAQDDARARVAGLPSPLWRRLARVPLFGPVLRALRALMRLPVLIDHQQQFEAYALGQQQQIADHINAIVAPAVADACDGVLMLSDALAELSQRHAQLEAAHAALEAQVAMNVEALEARATQLEVRSTQLETSATQAEIRAAELGARLDDERQQRAQLRQEQQEFLIQEQRVIVETQKVALADMSSQLSALAAAQEEKRAELRDEVRRLVTLVEKSQPSVAARAKVSAGADEAKRE